VNATNIKVSRGARAFFGQVERVQPEQASQLVLNRQCGPIESIKLSSDNTTGRKPRAWARFVYTGEEFGFLGKRLRDSLALAQSSGS
jgi:hypothetical protein